MILRTIDLDPNSVAPVFELVGRSFSYYAGDQSFRFEYYRPEGDEMSLEMWFKTIASRPAVCIATSHNKGVEDISHSTPSGAIINYPQNQFAVNTKSFVIFEIINGCELIETKNLGGKPVDTVEIYFLRKRIVTEIDRAENYPSEWDMYL